MEYNNNEENMITENPVILKEQNSNGSKIWYWIIGLLVLGALIWFAITSGWFGGKQASQETVIPVESNGGIGSENLAVIDAWQIKTSESFPMEKTLMLSGNLPDSCTYLGEVTQLRDGNNFYISLPTRVEEGICTQGLVPFEKAIELDILGLPAGVYTIDINGQQITFELEQDNLIEFSAGDSK